MSTLIDVLTFVGNAGDTSNEAKATKAKGKQAKGTKPDSLHDLILIDYSNAKATFSASGNEWLSFKAVLMASEKILADTEKYGLLVQDVKEVFKDLPEVARARVQYLNNARKVAFGGIVGSEQRGTRQVVSGKGWGAVTECIEKADSLRSFKGIISEAVPSAMKKAKSESEAQKAEDSKIIESATIADFADAKAAFSAAIDLLRLVDKQLKPSSDHELIMGLHGVIKGLERKLAS